MVSNQQATQYYYNSERLGAKGLAISDFIGMLERASDEHIRAEAKKHLLELGVFR